VLGNGRPGVSSGEAIRAVEETAARALPEGYQVAWSGQAFQEKRTGRASAIAFSLAIVMVFLILAALYERWLLPFAVVMAVPFAVAGALGLLMVNAIKPGSRLDPAIRAGLMETYKGQSDQAMGIAQGGVSIDLLVNVVPRNPVRAAADFNMLAIIFFSLMVGVALTRIPPERAKPMLVFLESLADVAIAIIGMVMAVAPYAVTCLIFSVTARFGFDLLVSLASYVVTVIAGLALFTATVYPLVLTFVSRVRPADFFRKARIVMVTAFSTSSSNATLPTTLRVAEQELGIPNQVAAFVVPLGATINMNGTALFEGVTVLFVAQVFGVALPLSQQIVVVLMSVVVAVGTAGVPGGSIPLLMIVLAMVGVPMEGIAIVIGVDRILDMCRTTVNVTGDLVTATVVNRFVAARTPGVTPASSHDR
jgi:DAACS family dicarboxylate/amino acid:cation (Na+ or H+) symporter